MRGATLSAASLLKTMPNIGALQSKKRELLGGVVHSILLYGASVWAETLTARRHKEILTRKVLIRMARACM